MDIIRGLKNLRPHHRPCVLSIGNYDGVHLGHQEIIRTLGEHGHELGLPVTIMTFEPYPQEYFLADRAPPRLAGCRDKMEQFRRLEVDQVFCVRFDKSLAETSADDFIRRYLVDGLGARHVVVGDDFRFGKGRTGDFALLKSRGLEFGFGVSDIPTYLVDGERVSSSRIRRALAAADFVLAERLLGRPFELSGRITHGDKRGRTIGFPTANIVVRHGTTPISGVFAVEVDGLGDTAIGGIANLGVRPTVGALKRLLEVHLFEFSQEIYGRRIRVRFLKKIRDEKRFSGLDALKAQIIRDVEHAHEVLGATKLAVEPPM